MHKHIKLQKDYTQNSDGYQLKLPLNIETIIPEDDSVRLLSQFVEGLDLTDLAIAHNINKLHNKIQNGKTGRHLFSLKQSA